MSFEVDWQAQLLRECENRSILRRDVAQTYRCLLEQENRAPGSVDWARINAAIIARWSKAALLWIKEAAWSGRCFKELSSPERRDES
jgi:hypothetical protein